MPQRILCYTCKLILFEGTEKLHLADEIFNESKGKCPKCGRNLFSTPLDAEVRPANKGNVFTVHGMDHTSLRELRTLLKNVGLNPIVLHERPNKGMTIIEKLEEYSKDVSFAFIILTPDDVGASKEEGLKVVSQIIGKNNPTQKDILKYPFKTEESVKMMYDLLSLNKDRARQNVILEFGYFIGKLGRRNVCCLYKGNIELPSDMNGVCYIHFENSIMEIRELILQELADERFIQFFI